MNVVQAKLFEDNKPKCFCLGAVWSRVVLPKDHCWFEVILSLSAVQRLSPNCKHALEWTSFAFSLVFWEVFSAEGERVDPESLKVHVIQTWRTLHQTTMP